MNSQNYHLSSDGFDVQAGSRWIYPTNYPARDYQYNIVEKSLFENTLVSLPTGLGKTFIAAVVMYNFYRWYPTSKIVFMAPSKPLVKQQVEACYNVMAIPKVVTAELTGHNVQQSRINTWNEKRIFYITPQILQNDLDLVPNLGIQIKCLVIDEAHRARGNHAYCEVVRKLHYVNKQFRILALSATPGKDHKDLSEIIRNLLIARVEFRTEDSIDVQPYTFSRNLKSVVVHLDSKLRQVKDEFLEVLEVFTRVLVKNNLITGNCSNLSKGRIFMLMKDYQERNSSNRNASYAHIIRNFNICVTLYHGYDLLLKHGLRSFQLYFKEHLSNPLLQNNEKLEQIVKDVEEYLGPPLNIEQLPDGNVVEIPESTKFGHPKFYKLRDILVEHFRNSGDDSRAMVFCEYCEGVREAYAILLQERPLIKPKCFMGQSSITQRQQISIIKSFRNGECNCLVSTCIGEEGLDIGEIDLIVCFDISGKNPTRMIQRIGRTGRKKSGQVVFLATEGREEQTLKECLLQRKSVNGNLCNSDAMYKQSLFLGNSRMVPDNIAPSCEKRHIHVENCKNNSLKTMFGNMSDKRKETLSQQLANVELVDCVNFIPDQVMLCGKENPLADVGQEYERVADFCKRSSYVRVQDRRPQSVNAQILSSLFQLIDVKKYNLPISEVVAAKIDQIKTDCGNLGLASNNLKQCDIRNIFLKSKTASDVPLTQDLEAPSTKTKNIFDNPEYIELNEEISNYINVHSSVKAKCDMCSDKFNCENFLNLNYDNVCKVLPWKDLGETFLDKIDADVLNRYVSANFTEKMVDNHSIQEEEEVNDLVILDRSADDENFEVLSFFKLGSIEDLYVPLDNMPDLENAFKKREEEHLQRAVHGTREAVSSNSPKVEHILDNNNDNMETSPIICSSRSLRNSLTSKIEVDENMSPVACNSRTILTERNANAFVTNSISKGTSFENESEVDMVETSPILSSQFMRKIPSQPSRKLLFESTTPSPKARPNLSILKRKQPCFFSDRKQTAENGRIVNDLKSKCDTETATCSVADLNSLCDMSMFGFTESSLRNEPMREETTKEVETQDMSVSQICDLSIFGFPTGRSGGRCKLRLRNSGNDSNNETREIQSVETEKPKPVNSSSGGEKSNKLKTVKNARSLFTKSSRSEPSNIPDSDEDDFQCSSGLLTNYSHRTPKNKSRPKEKKNCSFIASQAEVSNVITSDEDENENDDDSFDKSFIDDTLNHAIGHAMYLQSVKSPINNGKFKIPLLKPYDKEMILSQNVTNVDNTYVHDSFCVDNDVEHVAIEDDLSELEIAEQMLEIRKKEKRKKKSQNMLNTKRRRIMESNDESD